MEERFNFEELSLPVNWSRLRACDINRTRQKTDINTLMRYVDDICIGDTNIEDQDPGFMKAVTMAQLSCQYLMSCCSTLEHRKKIMKKALKAYKKEEDLLDLEISKERAKNRALSRVFQECTDLHDEYYSLLESMDGIKAKKYKRTKEKKRVSQPFRSCDDDNYFNDEDEQMARNFSKIRSKADISHPWHPSEQNMDDRYGSTRYQYSSHRKLRGRDSDNEHDEPDHYSSKSESRYRKDDNLKTYGPDGDDDQIQDSEEDEVYNRGQSRQNKHSHPIRSQRKDENDVALFQGQSLSSDHAFHNHRDSNPSLSNVNAMSMSIDSLQGYMINDPNDNNRKTNSRSNEWSNQEDWNNGTNEAFNASNAFASSSTPAFWEASARFPPNRSSTLASTMSLGTSHTSKGGSLGSLSMTADSLDGYSKNIRNESDNRNGGGWKSASMVTSSSSSSSLSSSSLKMNSVSQPRSPDEDEQKALNSLSMSDMNHSVDSSSMQTPSRISNVSTVSFEAQSTPNTHEKLLNNSVAPYSPMVSTMNDLSSPEVRSIQNNSTNSISSSSSPSVSSHGQHSNSSLQSISSLGSSPSGNSSQNSIPSQSSNMSSKSGVGLRTGVLNYLQNSSPSPTRSSLEFTLFRALSDDSENEDVLGASSTLPTGLGATSSPFNMSKQESSGRPKSFSLTEAELMSLSSQKRKGSHDGSFSPTKNASLSPNQSVRSSNNSVSESRRGAPAASAAPTSTSSSSSSTSATKDSMKLMPWASTAPASVGSSSTSSTWNEVESSTVSPMLLPPLSKTTTVSSSSDPLRESIGNSSVVKSMSQLGNSGIVSEFEDSLDRPKPKNLDAPNNEEDDVLEFDSVGSDSDDPSSHRANEAISVAAKIPSVRSTNQSLDKINDKKDQKESKMEITDDSLTLEDLSYSQSMDTMTWPGQPPSGSNSTSNKNNSMPTNSSLDSKNALSIEERKPTLAEGQSQHQLQNQSQHQNLAFGKDQDLISNADKMESSLPIPSSDEASDGITWLPGRASIDAIETSEALDILISGVRLEPFVIQQYKEFQIILSFADSKSPLSEVYHVNPKLVFQNCNFSLHMSCMGASMNEIIDIISREHESLHFDVVLLSDSKGDLQVVGSAEVNLWVMIEDACNILRQEVDIVGIEDGDVIGSLVVDVRGFHALSKCVNSI